MLVLEWKQRAFIEKVNSRCFVDFRRPYWCTKTVHQNGAPLWRLHTKLYKGAWNVSANNSETMGHKDLRLGQIVYILVFCDISFSWLLPLDGFQFNFCCVTVKTIYMFSICQHEGRWHSGSAWRVTRRERNSWYNCLRCKSVVHSHNISHLFKLG